MPEAHLRRTVTPWSALLLTVAVAVDGVRVAVLEATAEGDLVQIEGADA